MIDGLRKAKPAVAFNPVYYESKAVREMFASLLFVLTS